MKAFNIYLTGVGGQGIGLISETILRAADHAGHAVKSVDTHGLAQRGGIVVSHIRLGTEIFSPLVPAGRADLVIALERHEALRAMATQLKPKGVLVYYNTSWQPLSVRLNQTAETRPAEIEPSPGNRESRSTRCSRPIFPTSGCRTWSSWPKSAASG
ncbi:2-oxoacid:acceptor oxidoreductase family protein [Desulfosarcina cetonica]|uniref:2-oxoacid:acceptor oxidoreductase family protein n=1 Tax=Desulfosarcina cetonica TaxID=90730 RepID=UPI000A572399|nr:2-oxoacid:acceptor oxidoreductase family protein [Desulfosarcina cetonica]